MRSFRDECIGALVEADVSPVQLEPRMDRLGIGPTRVDNKRQFYGGERQGLARSTRRESVQGDGPVVREAGQGRMRPRPVPTLTRDATPSYRMARGSWGCETGAVRTAGTVMASHTIFRIERRDHD